MKWFIIGVLTLFLSFFSISCTSVARDAASGEVLWMGVPSRHPTTAPSGHAVVTQEIDWDKFWWTVKDVVEKYAPLAGPWGGALAAAVGSIGGVGAVQTAVAVHKTTRKRRVAREEKLKEDLKKEITNG